MFTICLSGQRSDQTPLPVLGNAGLAGGDRLPVELTGGRILRSALNADGEEHVKLAAVIQAGTVEDEARVKYERLLKNKGSNVVVGISHHSCGGCHMKLSRGTVVACLLCKTPIKVGGAPGAVKKP